MANTLLPIEIGASAKLVSAGWAIEKVLSGILMEEGLTVPKFSILLNLAKSKRVLRMNELAEASRCTPTYAGRVSASLAWKGLVECCPDGTDSRATLVSLSPLGVELIKTVLRRIDAFQTSELAGLARRFSVRVDEGAQHEVFLGGWD